MRAFTAFACALAVGPFVVAACSAPDPGGPMPRAFHPAGTTTSTQPTPSNNAPPASEPGDVPTTPTHPPPTPPSPTTPPPAPTTTGHDAGVPPVAFDAGTTPAKDASPGPVGQLGSCTNPACGTDPGQGYCGCTATDSNGNQVQLGCQPGGQCGCFVNQNLVNNTVQDENGLCGEGTSAQQQFFSQTCTCN